MRARRVGPGAPRSEGFEEGLVLAPDRATAAKLLAKTRAAVVLVAGRLPLRDGALDEIVDERADDPEAIAESVRVVRGGGKVVLVADARGGGGILGGLLKRTRRVLSPTDASAWLLGAGCEELAQSTPREGLVITEGRVRAHRPR
jgi:hypothetical protein